MNLSHPRDPLHGITLETIIKELVERYGWAEMGRRVPTDPLFSPQPEREIKLDVSPKNTLGEGTCRRMVHRVQRLLSEGYGSIHLNPSRIKEPRLHGLERHDL